MLWLQKTSWGSPGRSDTTAHCSPTAQCSPPQPSQQLSEHAVPQDGWGHRGSERPQADALQPPLPCLWPSSQAPRANPPGLGAAFPGTVGVRAGPPQPAPVTGCEPPELNVQQSPGSGSDHPPPPQLPPCLPEPPLSRAWLDAALGDSCPHQQTASLSLIKMSSLRLAPRLCALIKTIAVRVPGGLGSPGSFCTELPPVPGGKPGPGGPGPDIRDGNRDPARKSTQSSWWPRDQRGGHGGCLVRRHPRPQKAGPWP